MDKPFMLITIIIMAGMVSGMIGLGSNGEKNNVQVDQIDQHMDDG
jgi:hypothetical protein